MPANAGVAAADAGNLRDSRRCSACHCLFPRFSLTMPSSIQVITKRNRRNPVHCESLCRSKIANIQLVARVFHTIHERLHSFHQTCLTFQGCVRQMKRMAARWGESRRVRAWSLRARNRSGQYFVGWSNFADRTHASGHVFEISRLAIRVPWSGLYNSIHRFFTRIGVLHGQPVHPQRGIA